MKIARSLGVPVGSRTPTTVHFSACASPAAPTPCEGWNVSPTFKPVRDPTTASKAPSASFPAIALPLGVLTLAALAAFAQPAKPDDLFLAPLWRSPLDRRPLPLLEVPSTR